MMTPAMADYCIDELRYKAKDFEKSTTGALVVYNGDVVKSDTAVSQETKAALQRAVAPLENVPDNVKDWHPGSDEQVLDLVHPSLFPLVYGRSRVLAVGEKTISLHDCVARMGEGITIPIPQQPTATAGGTGRYSHRKNPYSTKFQWLPCEVDITGDRPRHSFFFLMYDWPTDTPPGSCPTSTTYILKRTRPCTASSRT
jgi:Protein of unknown function (DUF4246)